MSKLAKDPKLANLEVFQTSCFDDPYRFETSGIYIGEVWSAGEDESSFNNDTSAQERIDENGDDGEPTSRKCIVIEAY